MPIDLVIPVLNEVENLETVFAALEPMRRSGLVRRIVVADNGSTDGSAEFARRLGAIVVVEPRRGYGAACLAGLAELKRLGTPTSNPGAIGFLDADGSDDPTFLESLADELADHDLVIGTRARLAQPGALSAHQRFGNRFACRLMHVTTGVQYDDLGPMRLVRAERFDELQMQDRTWGWTVEMQTKAALLGWRIAQIDVPYRPRFAGRSKISGSIIGSVRAGYKILVTIVAIQWFWRPCVSHGDGHD